jgi:hypothetical protein
MNANKMIWVSKNYFQFTNLMMKIIGFQKPASFKKQTSKYMNDFKIFAENGISMAND